MVTSLPHKYLVDRGGGDWRVTQHLLEGVINDKLEWADALKTRDMLWVTTASRFSRFLFQANATGRYDPSRRVRNIRELDLIFADCVAHMPPAEQRLEVIDTVAFAAGHGAASFFHRLTPNRLAGVAEVSVEASAMRVKSIFAEGYVAAERDNPGAFQDMMELVLEAAGDGLAGKTIPLQTAEVITFLKDTSPEADGIEHLWEYTPHDRQTEEVQRRRQSEEGRFKALFIRAWDVGTRSYSNLELALPKPMPGRGIYDLLRMLSHRAKLHASLTAPVAKSVNDLLRTALPKIDTAALRTADNGERAERLGAYLSVAHSEKSADAVSAADEGVSLHVNADFKAFVTAIEALDVRPLDMVKVATAMATAVHPAGLVYLAGGNDGNLTVLKGMKGVRDTHVVDDALNAHMILELVPNPRGRRYTMPGVADKLLRGVFAKPFCIYKSVVVPLLLERDGKGLLENESDDSGSFWTDMSRISLAEEIIVAAFKFYGYTGRHAGSVASFIQGMKERSRKLKALPATYRKTGKMRELLQSIGEEAMEGGATQHRAMLALSPEKASRVVDFFPANGNANKQMKEYDAMMIKCEEEVKFDELNGDDNGSSGGAPGNAGASSANKRLKTWPSPSLGKPTGGTPMTTKGNFPQGKRSTTLDVTPRQLQFNDATFQKMRGWAVYDYGIAASDFEGAIFGGAYWMKLRDGAPMINLNDICLACIAPPIEDLEGVSIKGCQNNLYHGLPLNQQNRFLWCTKGCDDPHHGWPEGTHQKDWEKINIYKPKNDDQLRMCQQLIADRDKWQRWYPSALTSDGVCTRFAQNVIGACMLKLANLDGFYDPTKLALKQQKRGPPDAGSSSSGGKGDLRFQLVKYQKGDGKGGKGGGGKGTKGGGKVGGKGGDKQKDFQRQRK